MSISQRTRLYVVVKNREKRVTGGGRVIDVRQLERNGWRKCGSGCVLPVVSGFLHAAEQLYTLPVRSTLHTEGSECKVTKNLETYEL